VINPHGLSLDTTSATQDSEAILEDALSWASKTLGIVYRREMVKRKTYASQFTFYSDVPLLHINPVLEALSEEVCRVVAENLKLPTVIEPTAILLGQDPEAQRIPVFPFSIERRQSIAFSEGKYFSSAPLPTDKHIAVVEKFEKSIMEQRKK
jgi:hypothetical protein